MGDRPVFGEELRRRRIAARRSLADLARAVHYSKSYLSKIETGRSPPNRALAAACDRALETGGALEALLALQPKTRARRRRPAGGRVVSLPPDSIYFTGRSRELDRLLAILSGPRASNGATVWRGGGAGLGLGDAAGVCVVRGMPGVGKTALVVHAAYLTAPSFPDGCLYLDLHGYTQGTAPIGAAEALDRYLRQLGVPAETIPEHIDGRAALYRDRLRGRCMLIVIDNVRSVDDVMPMVPAEPSCRVLVTSRGRLTALDEASHVSLDVLPPGDSAALFRLVAGDRLVGERDAVAVDRIAAWCGGLPLAIRIAGAKYRDGSVDSLDNLERSLADEHRRLGELDDGHRSASAAFTTSYETLPVRERRLFGLLALHPGHDIDAHAATALAGTDPATVTRSLVKLHDAHLLTRERTGRYGFHDLVRAFAIETVRDVMPGAELDTAVDRLLDYYNDVADRAEGVLNPHRYRMPLDIEYPPAAVPPLRDHVEALNWFEVEAANLVAACRSASDRGRHSCCWQLAYSLRGFFFLTKRYDDWVKTHRAALAAARDLADPRAEACTRNNLGLALMGRGDHAGAMEQYLQALTLFRELGDDHGVSNTLGHCAWVHHLRGESRTALSEYEEALAYYRRTDADRYVAITLRDIAVVEIALGRVTKALTHLTTAVEMFLDLEETHDAAMAFNRLGEAYRVLGDQQAAVAAHKRAIALGHASGSRFEEARAHEHLGLLAASTGDERLAREHLALALAGYESVDARAASRVRQRLRSARIGAGVEAAQSLS